MRQTKHAIAALFDAVLNNDANLFEVLEQENIEVRSEPLVHPVGMTSNRSADLIARRVERRLGFVGLQRCYRLGEYAEIGEVVSLEIRGYWSSLQHLPQSSIGLAQVIFIVV